jgi:hypothetical protein
MLIANGTCRSCLQHLPATEEKALVAEMDAYVARAKPLVAYLHTLNYRDMPEERWVRYFEDVFERSEPDAIQALSDERHGQPGTATVEE